MPKPVNVPPEYFHCPQLAKRERVYLIQKARDSAKALVESTRSGSQGPIRWLEAGYHKGVKMFKGEARDPGAVAAVGEQVNYACGATTIQASIEEVAEFFDFSTTAKAKAFAATQDDMMDHVVLYTLAEPREENDFLHQITVKWFAMNMPSPVIRDRDFLTLECQDTFTDPSGRRGWVRSYHSVKLACCPDLQKEMGFVRGSFYHTGYVFVESEKPGMLDCVFSCQVNLKGSLYLPSSLHFAAMKRRIGAVADLPKLLLERRLGKHQFLSDLELVPKSHRVRCDVCLTKFGVLTRKTRCRKCGEVVCHACTQHWEISSTKFGTRKVRVCLKCCAASSKSTIDIQEHLETVSLSSERQSIVHANVDHHASQEPLSARRASFTPRARTTGEARLGVPFSRRELSDGEDSYLSIHDMAVDYGYEVGEAVPSPPSLVQTLESSPPRGVPLYHAEENGQRMVPGSYLTRSYTRQQPRDKLAITQVSYDTVSSTSDYEEDDEDRTLSARALEQHSSLHASSTSHSSYSRNFSYAGPVKTRANQNGMYYDPASSTITAPGDVDGRRPRGALSAAADSACAVELSSLRLLPRHPAEADTASGLSFSSVHEHSHVEREGEEAVAFDGRDLYSPVSRAIADDFSTLLQPEAARDTGSSLCFSIGSTSTSASTARTPEASLTLVELYQNILELTKRQHTLDITPMADVGVKDAVAEQLRELYQQLSDITGKPQ